MGFNYSPAMNATDKEGMGTRGEFSTSIPHFTQWILKYGDNSYLWMRDEANVAFNPNLIYIM